MAKGPLFDGMGGRVAALAACALAIALSLAACATATGARVNRPNVLVIMTDDQRPVGTMDVMPRTRSWFGSRGTRFPNTVATTPFCCPSRASIFSGRYAHNHGVKGNNDAGVLDQRFTIQRYLDDAGYRTGIAGKFLNGWQIGAAPQYFDRWSLFEGGYSNVTVSEQGTISTAPYSTTWARQRALDFLAETEANDKQPWLLYVTPFAPHFKPLPEAKYASATVPARKPSPAYMEADRSDKPAHVQRLVIPEENVEQERVDGLRTLLSVDEAVQAIMTRLRDSGELDNTLAFFMSDNGLAGGDHGLIGKEYPYSNTARIPMYMRWSGRVAAGAVETGLAANIDVAPTVMQAAQLTPALPMDGRSLLSPPVRPRVLLEMSEVPGLVPTWASVKTPTLQYVEYYDSTTGSVGFKEYYDLVNDQYQLTNRLADGDPGNDPPTAQLASQLATDRTCAGTVERTVAGRPPCP